MAESGNTVNSCGVCKELLRASATPKFLACHHTFCLDCLKDCVKHSPIIANKLKCPTCRMLTTLPAGGLQKLQTNFYIGETPKDDTMCDACGHNLKLNRRCLDCQQNFCDMCASTHIKMASSREHTLADISDEQDEDEISKAKTRDFCKIHKTDELKMFCKDCSEVMCIICKLTKHEGHTSTDIATEAAERRKAIRSLIENSAEKLHSTERNTTTTENNTKANYLFLQKSVASLEKEKKKVVVRVQSVFEGRIISIKHLLDVYQEKTTKAVETGKKTSETFSRIIENSIKSLQEESDLDIIIQFDKLSKDVNEIKDVRCNVTCDKHILNLLEESRACVMAFNETLAKMPLAASLSHPTLDTHLRSALKK